MDEGDLLMSIALLKCRGVWRGGRRNGYRHRIGKISTPDQECQSSSLDPYHQVLLARVLLAGGFTTNQSLCDLTGFKMEGTHYRRRRVTEIWFSHSSIAKTRWSMGCVQTNRHHSTTPARDNVTLPYLERKNQRRKNQRKNQEGRTKKEEPRRKNQRRKNQEGRTKKDVVIDRQTVLRKTRNINLPRVWREGALIRM